MTDCAWSMSTLTFSNLTAAEKLIRWLLFEMLSEISTSLGPLHAIVSSKSALKTDIRNAGRTSFRSKFSYASQHKLRFPETRARLIGSPYSFVERRTTFFRTVQFLETIPRSAESSIYHSSREVERSILFRNYDISMKISSKELRKPEIIQVSINI